jgi:PAS domain S-box-containing protein
MSDTTILIVEDEAIVAADLAGKLGQLGYQIAGIAARGAKAIALTQELHPNLVLMDIRLAGPMDGVEAAERIRRDYDVPVIYLTAHSDRATLQRAKLTEPYGYILKPFDERELETCVQIALYKHQAERKLREQREWLRVTLNSIGDAVVAADTEGRVTFLNPVAVSLTGWTAAEVVGQPARSVFNLVSEVTGEPLEDFAARVLLEKRVVPLGNHAALVTKDGRRVPIEDSASPITDAQGNVIGVVLVFHDVTEKRQAEAALDQARAQLEKRVLARTSELSEANRALQSEIERRQQAEDAQMLVLRRLKESEETERSRISRELHDRLGQDLTALKLGLRRLQEQCPFVAEIHMPCPEASEEARRGRVADKFRARLGRDLGPVELGLKIIEEQCPFAQDVQKGVTKLERIADGVMRSVHRLAWELHPRVLDDLGLEAALRRYAAEWAENSAVPVDFHSDGMETDRLPLELETALYRVTQEALTNVLRHAQARRVSVLLERRADRVSLIVEDDGVGFDTSAVFLASGTRGKLGLLGMQERIRLAGGTIDIESTLKQGTTVFVRVPIEGGIPPKN